MQNDVKHRPQPPTLSTTPSPGRPRAPVQVCQVAPPCSWLKTIAQAVVTFGSDMEVLFVPFVALEARHAQPLKPVASSPAAPVESSASRPTRRATPGEVATARLSQWLESGVKPGPATAGPRIFAGTDWTPLTGALADLVKADCGPALSQVVRESVRAAAALAGDQKAAAASAAQSALVKTLRTQLAQQCQQGLGSGALWQFVAGSNARVAQWEAAGSGRLDSVRHVGANILIACGLRNIAQELANVASEPERGLYLQLAWLAPVLAGAADPLKEARVIGPFNAANVKHVSADVLTYCARQVVAAEAALRRQADGATHYAETSVSRTPVSEALTQMDDPPSKLRQAFDQLDD